MLKGRTALITGVSRRNGIGFATARRLASMGADLFLHAYAPYDRQFPSVGEIPSAAEIAHDLQAHGTRIEQVEADFADPESPGRVVRAAVDRLGHLDILVINHTHDTLKTLDELTADEIDRHLSINVRAALLLIQEYGRQHRGRPGGRIILLTSGQHLEAMPHMGYVASKGALHQLTASLSAHFVPRGITVNTVNPGPTKTYDPGRELNEAVLGKMPLGRWGEPDDAARLIAWLVSDEAAWVTGQVIDSEGGFLRE